MLPIDIISVLSAAQSPPPSSFSVFLPRVFGRNTNPPSRNFILSLHETEALAMCALSPQFPVWMEDLSVDTRQIFDKSLTQPLPRTASGAKEGANTANCC